VIAAVYSGPGDASVFEVRDFETPEPGPGEVRVRVAVSGVNPSDWKSRLKAPAPFGEFKIPHQDGAGTIDALGEGVDADLLGKRVWLHSAAYGRRWGTAAQWSVVPVEQAVPMPDAVSFELGAGLGVPAMTAYRALCADGPIAGKTALIPGGAGAVGHAAIQIAKAEGARVVTTVSGEEKAKIAREAGADEVVNYRDADVVEQLAAAAPEGVDRVVELSLVNNLALDLPLLNRECVISVYSTEGGVEAQIPLWPLITPNAVVRFVMIYGVPADALAQGARRITEIAAAGELVSPPLHRFPLSDISHAQDAVAAGTVGKVLLDIPD
jgi:NADPH2:quinone reductase